MFEFNFNFEGLTRAVEQITWPNREEIVVPQKDLGKSFSYSKSKISDPSTSIDEINIPEVTNLRSEFVYNFYTNDERLNPFERGELPLSKIPRYVSLSWVSPFVSKFESEKVDIENNSARSDNLSIQRNADKIISEDNFFNPSYVNHTFSNVDSISQGCSDLENYSIMARHGAESVFKMSREHIKESVNSKEKIDDYHKDSLVELTDAYAKLADFPKSSLGLRIYDEDMNLLSDSAFLQDVINSVSLKVKINSAVLPDIFINSKEKNTNNYKALAFAHAESLGNSKRKNTLEVSPVLNDTSKASYLTQPIKYLGYVLERYKVTPDGFVKEQTFYIEDIQKTVFEDTSVLYGHTYLYTVKVVTGVNVLTYQQDDTSAQSSLLYVSSKPVSAPVECYEFVPPPEPENLKFTFDYDKRNLTILWDMPVNPQKDVKQFQIFRRKSIQHPFELIAQYGFDASDTGAGSNGRYKTGERIDANNYFEMSPDDRNLVTLSDKPVYMHTDEDFTVDPEFFISSEYIYAIAAVDAHGMISNYSSQHYVTFDSQKNRISTKVVCDSGSPRQYPNMRLRTDAFKDTIRIEGQNCCKLDVRFTPEYLKVKDDRNVTYNIVEAKTAGSNSYYLMQLINLDNQKMQLVKINVKDPMNLTL